MDAEELLLSLFDSNWFGHKTNPRQSESDLMVEEEKVQESCNILDHHDHREFSFPVPQNLKVRSLSEQLLDPKLGSFFSSDNSLTSPSSVLASKKLQTIFSGKEVNKGGDEHDVVPDEENDKEEVRKLVEAVSKKINDSSERRRKRRSRKRDSKLGGGFASKSLSDLEFEELKGFMDLGFVFTEEECRDSKLVSIIPGLQRLCQKCTSNNSTAHIIDHDEYCDHSVERGGVISRPYLSEAWDVLEVERMKKEHHQIMKPLVMADWNRPALSNEIYMKDQLKIWAHSVASTVK